MLRRFALSVAGNVAAFFVASVFLDGIDYAEHLWILFLAAFVFTAVNVVVKPVVTLLALPLILLTFGVALFFVNLFMLYLTSWIVGPFEIASFGSAVAATVIIWAVNVALNMLFGLEARRERKLRR